MEDNAFGDLLREYRVAAQLSQEMLAERARLSSAAISALERNVRRGPQRQTLALLAQALDLSADERARLERAARAGRRRLPRPASLAAPEPAPRSAAAPTNITRSLTSFLGRVDELTTLERLIATRPLISLVGPGGVGKTRLALEIGQRARAGSAFPDGIWFIDLAPAVDRDGVVSALTHSLAVAETVGANAMDDLRRALAPKRLLLILDNCEQTIDDAAGIAEAVLHAAPQVTIVATSREPLRADGECVVRIAPLAVTAERGRSPALDLLLDRLRDADYTRYAVVDDALSASAQLICRRLDGLPLALELAAARGGELSLDAIVRSLDERFTLLSAGRRTGTARHSTLSAAIAWSVDLLRPDERLVFRRIGLFIDAFSVDDAVAVAGDGTIDVAAALRALAAKSLVTSQPGSGHGVRYRLLESMRAFALERLRESGEFDARMDIFAHRFRERARAADAMYGHVSRSDFVASVEPDLEHDRAALDWFLIGERDIAAGAELAGSIGWIFRQLSLFSEGRRWALRALAHEADLAPAVVGRLQLAISSYAFALGMMPEASEAAAAAVVAYRRSGSRTDLAAALTLKAYCAYRSGRLEAVLEASREAVALARAELDLHRLAGALNAYALSIPPERSAERIAILEEAIACCRATGNHDTIVPTAHLAAAYYEAGRHERAIACAGDTVAMARSAPDRSTLAGALSNYAGYALGIDAVDDAAAAAREALELVSDLGKTLLAMCSLQHLGTVAARRGHPERAARLLGATSALYHDFGFAREATEQQLYDRTVAIVSAAIGADALQRHLDAGFAMGIDAAIAYGLVVE